MISTSRTSDFQISGSVISSHRNIQLDPERVSRYVNDRIDMIFQLFGTSDLPTIEAALAKCYQVNADGRGKILDYIKYIYDTSQDEKRVKAYKDKVGTHL